MNILLINHYAGSDTLGMEYRPYYFAKEWIKQGHTVSIVAASYSHIRSVNPEMSAKYVFEDIDGIEYLWIRTPKYQSNSPKRFINMLIFIYRLCRVISILLKRRKFDVVIASSTYPLDIFPAKKIAKKSKAQLLFEVHDLWPLSPMELGGYSKWHPFIMLMQYAENTAYRVSDKVISMLPKTKEHMMAHGLKEEKWFFIPNGINLSEWKDFEAIPEDVKIKLNSIREKYKRIVAYTGTYGLANALDTYLDAAKLLKDDSIAFVLFGKGPMKQNLKNRVNNELLEHVYIFDNVPKRSIPHLLSFFDLLYIGWKDQFQLYRFGISPNKIMDYMMSAKPIIHAVKAGNDMVADAKCGLSIEPENPTALAQAIKTLSLLSDETLAAYGENGRNYVLANHVNSILANQFIAVIQKQLI